METWRQTHPTQELIAPDGQPVDIDEEMVPLIREIWRLGFTTFMCCQDMGEAIQGGGLTHMPESAREANAARSMGRAMLRIRAGETSRLLADLNSAYIHGDWLASIPVTPAGPAAWAMVTFPRPHIEQAVQALRHTAGERHPEFDGV